MVRQQEAKVALVSSDAAACPGENTFLALIEGRLDEAQGGDVVAHLSGCPECREVFSEVARPNPLAIGRRFGRYTTRRLIGAGAMGFVYEAFDPLLSRRVALKLIRREVEGGDSHDAGRDLRARLLREAKALARLQHPNVVTVHDLGETDDGLFFIAMELVEGETVGRWLPRKKRGWQEVLDVYLEAGRGLAAAHEAGVVHRDFKPSNVLVATVGDRVVVTDFGLARVMENSGEEDLAIAERPRALATDPAITRTGTLLGSPAYMSPEQLAGKHADVRSDIFGFCVSLWAGLYGVRPFSGVTVNELRRAIAAQTPTPQGPGHSVPERIRETLAKGLRESPDERPQRLEDLLHELERQRTHEGLSRAERILGEAEELFPPGEKARAMPAVAVSLLEGVLVDRLSRQKPAARPDSSELAPIELSGRPMQRFMDLIGPFKWIMSHFMTRAGLLPSVDGLAHFDPEGWYSYSLALDFALSEPFGPEVAYRIGYHFSRAVLETHGVSSSAPFTIATLVRVDEAFDRCLRLNGVTLDRLGGVRERKYMARESGAIEVQTPGFARCSASRGYFAAIVEHFATAGEVVHLEGPCRDRGDRVCRYLLRPSSASE
jgi:serine/threonine protein kinase